MPKRDFPTYEDGENFIHYTCQSVDEKKLKKQGIEEVGEKFGIGGGRSSFCA